MIASERPDRIVPALSDADVQRLWRRVARTSAMAKQRARKRWWPRAVALGAALGVTAPRAAESPASQAPASAGGIVLSERFETLELPDGSRVRLGSSTELNLIRSGPGVIEIVLTAGQAHFEVSDVVERRFSVFAAGVEVSANAAAFTLGTEFVAQGKQGEETLRVGLVIDHGKAHVWRLGAEHPTAIETGESWSSDL